MLQKVVSIGLEKKVTGQHSGTVSVKRYFNLQEIN
jgi:hypothetical protein